MKSFSLEDRGASEDRSSVCSCLEKEAFSSGADGADDSFESSNMGSFFALTAQCIDWKHDVQHTSSNNKLLELF